MLRFDVCILTAVAILSLLVSHTVVGSRQDEDIPLRTKVEMGIQGVAYGNIHEAFFNDGHWRGEALVHFRY
jgi:hypothetical protein